MHLHFLFLDSFSETRYFFTDVSYFNPFLNKNRFFNYFYNKE
jgi:hypothetical protein